jgi:hypothetical protein
MSPVAAAAVAAAVALAKKLIKNRPINPRPPRPFL